MRILVACEFSGRVRDAFADYGHSATSCDLLPSETRGAHIQGDVRSVDVDQYDMVIGFPPCTHLSSSGARWWGLKEKEQQHSIEFFLWFTRLQMPWAIENPVGIMSSVYRKPDQIIQPWQFGHGETKATCLWLHKLPLLKPSKIVGGRQEKVHRMPDSKGRSRQRSLTYSGVAEAMAAQWGSL